MNCGEPFDMRLRQPTQLHSHRSDGLLLNRLEVLLA